MPHIPAGEDWGDRAPYDPIQMRLEVEQALSDRFGGLFHGSVRWFRVANDKPFVYYDADHAAKNSYNQRHLREAVRQVYRDTTVNHSLNSVYFFGTSLNYLLLVKEEENVGTNRRSDAVHN